LWNVETGALVRDFKGYKEKEFEKGHHDGVFCLAASPDGKRLASGSSDHTVKLWNVADGTVIRDFLPKDPKKGLVDISLDHSPEKAKDSKKTPASPFLYPLSHPGWVYSVRFSRDGKTLVSAGTAPRNRGYLAVWDVATGRLRYSQELPLGPIYSLAVSPDGSRLALACGPVDRQKPEAN